MNTQIFNFKSMASKVTNGHLSFREFKEIIHNTFIYESILIKIYINNSILTLWKVLMDNFLFLFFQYCDNNVGFFSIAPDQVIA